MESGSFGLIEIVLAFGLVLGFAVWELVRNRRELERLKRAKSPGDDATG